MGVVIEIFVKCPGVELELRPLACACIMYCVVGKFPWRDTTVNYLHRTGIKMPWDVVPVMNFLNSTHTHTYIYIN
jgi:hypothetical protein